MCKPRQTSAAVVCWLVLSLVLSSCAPAATIERRQPFSAAWDGPIETVALAMSAPPRGLEQLATQAFSITLSEFMWHRYARQRFDVIERQAVDDLIREVRLGQSGLVDARTAPRLGQLLGARYIILFDLVDARVRVHHVGGIDIGGVRVGGNLADLNLVITVRLVDVETGRVRASGSGRVSSQVLTGLSVDDIRVGSSAELDLLLDLVPEAAVRAFNALFRQIAS